MTSVDNVVDIINSSKQSDKDLSKPNIEEQKKSSSSNIGEFFTNIGSSINSGMSAAAGGLRRAGAGLTADAGDKEKVSNETNVVKDVTEQFKYDTGDNGQSNKIQQVPDKNNFKDAYTEEEIKLDNDGKSCSIYVKKPTADGNDYDLSYVKINKSILANAKMTDGSKFFQRSGLLGVGEPGKKTKLHESWEKEQKYIQKVYDENPKYFSGATVKVGEDKMNLLDPDALAESDKEEAAALVEKERDSALGVSKTVSPSPESANPKDSTTVVQERKSESSGPEESKTTEVVVEERESESSGPGESEKTEVVVQERESDVQSQSGAGKTRRRRKSRSKRRKGKTSKGRKSPKSKKRRQRKGKGT